jgi:hypothetical protein
LQIFLNNPCELFLKPFLIAKNPSHYIIGI